MPKVKLGFNTFESGEASPSFSSRVDSPIFKQAAKQIRNMIVLSEGGVRKRPGLKYSGVKVGSDPLLIPFIFSTDEQYIIVIAGSSLKAYSIGSDGGLTLVDTDTTIYDGSDDEDDLPWDSGEIDLREIRYAQSADTLFLVHPTFEPLKVTRFSASDFRVERVDFDITRDQNRIHQPYFSFQPPNTTITVNSISAGAGRTVTTSADYFGSSSAHSGAYLLLGTTMARITSVQSATQATVVLYNDVKQDLPINPVTTTQGSNLVRITFPNHGLVTGQSVILYGLSDTGGISHTNLDGSQTVFDVLDEDTFTYNCGHNANDSVVGGGFGQISSTVINQWAETAVSNYRGWFNAVAFHENRLWFGGSPSLPDHLWASKPGIYLNFDIGDGEPSDAIDLASGFGEFNEIRHLVSNRDLQIFMDSSEAIVPSNPEAPITPANAQIKRQTPFGCNKAQPAVVDGSTVFVYSSGASVGSFIFTNQEKAYSVNNISYISEHLINTPINIQTASGKFNRPETFTFFTNTDGTLAVLYTNKSTNQAGWFLWTTNGNFKSTCVVDERVYAAVSRTYGGSTNTYIEEFRYDAEMDCQEQYTINSDNPTRRIEFDGYISDPSDQFTAGNVVDIYEGTKYLGAFTIDGSNHVSTDLLDLITGTNKVEVGYKFEPILETFPLNLNTKAGSLRGNFKTVDIVTLDLRDTISVSVNDSDVNLINVNQDFSTDFPAFSGIKEVRPLGVSREPTVKISQSQPFALEVTGFDVEFNG